MGADYRKVLTAIANLFMHLNNRYNGDKNLNEGVRGMLIELDFEKHSYERGEQQKAEEIAISLLDVLDVETIAAKTKLALEKVKELREQYLKNTTEGQ